MTGWLGGLAERARRYWPVGVVVAVVTALVGLAVAWESPHVFQSRATVFVPANVTNQAAGQRYIADMEAAINSATVKDDVARAIGVSPSVFNDPIVVRRIGQSNVMATTLQTTNRLKSPADALSRLVARAGQSLAAPDVVAAKAQLDRATAGLNDAESVAVAAKKARDSFLAERNGVTPDDELAILGPQLAQLRLCATGAIVPPGGSSAACQAQLTRLESQATSLAQASDELAALDRDRDEAEADVQDAQRDRPRRADRRHRRQCGTRRRGDAGGRRALAAAGAVPPVRRHPRRRAASRAGRGGRPRPPRRSHGRGRARSARRRTSGLVNEWPRERGRDLDRGREPGVDERTNGAAVSEGATSTAGASPEWTSEPMGSRERGRELDRGASPEWTSEPMGQS